MEESQRQHYVASEDSNSLIQEYTESYPVEGRRNKQTKLFKVFKCVCKVKHHSKKQILKHKEKCQKRHYLKKRFSNSQVIEEEEIISKNVQMVTFQELQSFKKRLSALQQQQEINVDSTYFDAFKKAQKFIDKYQATLLGIILNKLASSLQNANRAGIKIVTMENSIAAAVICMLQSLNFDLCVQQLSEKLSKAHQQLVQQSTNHKSKTKKYNERAYNFMSQFSQFQLGTQIRLFDQLIKLDSTQRKNVCRYFSRLRKLDPYFGKFPPLPKLYKSVPRGAMLSKVSIEEAARQIRILYSQGNKELACDAWMLITLGLRFQDLLRIYFILDQGLVKFVKIKEAKNNNIACRYIPLNLLEMIIESGVSYPTTYQRLRRAVKFCLGKFRSSYGFKHRAITAILTALHRANPLGRMHSRPDMTANHYLNHNDQTLLDSAFAVGITFEFGALARNQINQRDIELDLTESVPKYNKLSKKITPEITIDCENILYNRLITSALDGQFAPEELGNNIISVEQRHELVEIATISRDHFVELSAERFNNIEEAIGSLDPENILIQATQQLAQQVGEDFNQELLVQKLSSASEHTVYLYQFSNEGSGLRYSFPQSLPQQNEDASSIIISKNEKGYAISNAPILYNKKRLASIIAQQKLKPARYLHRPFAPFCHFCKSKKIFCLLESADESGIKCGGCGWKDEKLGKLFPFKNEVSIKSCNQDILDGLDCVKLQKSKNNLVQMVVKQFGSKFSASSKYSCDFPEFISTTFKEASPSFERQLDKCRIHLEKLPLHIKDSLIPSAGLGMFATQAIPENTLLLTYTGIIGTSFSIIDKQKNNSLFTVGWVIPGNPEDSPFQALIDGRELTGPARYINSSNGVNKSNLSVSTIILRGQIVVYFYTIRNINKDQELLFFYGKKYWQKNSPLIADQSDSESQEE